MANRLKQLCVLNPPETRLVRSMDLVKTLCRPLMSARSSSITVRLGRDHEKVFRVVIDGGRIECSPLEGVEDERFQWP